ncbi:hypothetical protein [Neorhizobium huautlense]|uniref:hypothetical protein n=1 Tax=Neorhizobium huautlense TaxID=67774 RepID=UPI001300416D|nr:hypothetical protein [Neorhizobium huautlense]
MKQRNELVRPDRSETYDEDWMAQLEEGLHELTPYGDMFRTDDETPYRLFRAYDRLRASSHRPD